ncbi:MAG: hypothetical protein K1X87_12420 [Dehalococcoidia bacterium]|nr:hypothetical protein [Dehalococcoidia bacterium]
MPPNVDSVPNNVIAALLLTALPHLRRLELGAPPTATAVLLATGACRSRAYELVRALETCLGGLARPVGRPAAPVTSRPGVTGTAAVSQAVLEYLMTHPGAVTQVGERRRYSDGFRALALRLTAEHSGEDRADVARAVGIPAATLDDWWAERERLVQPSPAPAPPRSPSPEDAVTESRIAALLDLWRSWDGGFSAFAGAVRRELEIPWGDTRIGKVLATYGNRRSVPRPGRRPDEKAQRDAFRTFFPGAQWTEDGTELVVTLNGERFAVNLELVVDTSTSALVGAHLSDQETGPAVAAAFEDGVTTTGARPIALGTDNATENDAPEVAVALGETLHLHATLGRPQNDAHVEGAFGLFQQVAPPLVVNAKTPRELASAILRLVVTVWARTLNHRPRKARAGKSRVDLYREAEPTPEQRAAARAFLTAVQRAHDQAERTRRRRADPVARAALDGFFDERRWADPNAHLRDAIAGYGLDIVLAALATWRAKDEHGHLPEGASPRYLLGITRQLQCRRELTAMADDLWRRRVDAGDLIAARLDTERSALQGTVEVRLDAALNRLVTAPSLLARIAWTTTVADFIRTADPPGRRRLYDRAVAAIVAAYALDRSRRAALLHAIAERVLPLAA